MTTALKEIHIENSKKRDASVRFVSLIRENDPKPAYKGKTIKNSRLLISSDETSEDSLINKYKSPSEKILTTRKNVFFHSAKVSLYNKSVLQQQTQFFYDLKKNVKIKLMPKQLITYHLLN